MGTGDPLKGSLVPGFGSRNRVPETSRVHKKRASGTRTAKPVVKGLARSCVSVKSIGNRTFEVRVKGSLHILGYIRSSQGAKGSAYSYKLIGETKSHNGFASQKAAVTKMLEKC